MSVRVAVLLVSILFAAGSMAHAAQNKDEDAVREAWTALQAAIKAKDGDKIWALLDKDTQGDVERAAKKVQSVYKKANDKQKEQQEKFLGLSAAELGGDLKPALLLKSRPFIGKYHEIPDSKVTGITVQGDKATLNYLEPDNDKEKLSYSRQDGKWKAAMPLPKFTK